MRRFLSITLKTSYPEIIKRNREIEIILAGLKTIILYKFLLLFLLMISEYEVFSVIDLKRWITSRRTSIMHVWKNFRIFIQYFLFSANFWHSTRPKELKKKNNFFLCINTAVFFFYFPLHLYHYCIAYSTKQSPGIPVNSWKTRTDERTNDTKLVALKLAPWNLHSNHLTIGIKI